MKLIAPHKVVSKRVKEEDIPLILKTAPEMLKLLFEKHGLYNGGEAIAHSQITKSKPLRFFVNREGIIVANPKIISHTNSFVDSKESCLSFPFEKPALKLRYNKITVCYFIVTERGFGDVLTANIGGRPSKIFQHEIDHFDGKYIYKGVKQDVRNSK